MSYAFAKRLCITPTLLDDELCVGTLLLYVREEFRSCKIEIGESTLEANLILLAMHEFDVILSMDWLSTYCASVKCYEKEVMFQLLGEPEFNFVDTKLYVMLKVI